ncbi:MAG: hypothetical protein ACE5IR_06185 [bacterium]
MKHKLFILSIAVMALFILQSTSDVSAYPWFARRLVDNCNKCHVSFPKTNDYGWYVKATGYELPEMDYTGLEESPVKRFLRYLPMAVRFKVDAMNSNPSEMEGDLNIRAAQLISGGSILNNRVSWWFHKHLMENNEFEKLFSGVPHEMWGQYNFRFGKSDATRVSVRYGMSELPLRFSPSKTDISEVGYAIYNAMLGENAIMLGMPQYGAVLKGVKLGGDSYNQVRSTFDLALVNGTGDFSSYDFTQVFARVGTTVGSTMFGAFTYLGSKDLPMSMQMDGHADEGDHHAEEGDMPADEHTDAVMTVGNNYLRVGLDFDLNVTPMFNIYGLGLYGRDSNPLGLEMGASGHYYGGFLGMDYSPTERFMITWRYDAVRFGNLPAMAHDEHADEGDAHSDEHAGGGGHMHGEMVTSNADAMVFGANFLLPLPNYQVRLTSEYLLGFRGLSDKLIIGLQFAL